MTIDYFARFKDPQVFDDSQSVEECFKNFDNDL